MALGVTDLIGSSFRAVLIQPAGDSPKSIDGYVVDVELVGGACLVAR